jgi:hypothetical protein
LFESSKLPLVKWGGYATVTAWSSRSGAKPEEWTCETNSKTEISEDCGDVLLSRVATGGHVLWTERSMSGTGSKSDVSGISISVISSGLSNYRSIEDIRSTIWSEIFSSDELDGLWVEHGHHDDEQW